MGFLVIYHSKLNIWGGFGLPQKQIEDVTFCHFAEQTINR